MKNKFLGMLPYICAVLVAIGLIIGDIVGNNISYNQYLQEQEDMAKSLVESSQVRYNGQIYHGVYESEEVLSLSSDYILVGRIEEMIDDETELTNDFTSHVLPSGFDVYASEENTNMIYVDITADGDDVTTYIPYILD